METRERQRASVNSIESRRIEFFARVKTHSEEIIKDEKLLKGGNEMEQSFPVPVAQVRNSFSSSTRYV